MPAVATLAVGAYSAHKQSKAAESQANAARQAQQSSDAAMINYYREADKQRQEAAEKAAGILDSGANKAFESQIGRHYQAQDQLNTGYENARGNITNAYADSIDSINQGYGQANELIGNAGQQAISGIQTADNRAISSISNAYADANNRLASGTNQASDLLNQGLGNLKQAYDPYTQAGENSINRINDMVGNGSYETSELYKLQAKEGLDQLNKHLAGQGLRKSGENIKASSDFLQRLGAEEAERQFARASQAASLTNDFAQQAGQADLNVAGQQAGLQQGLAQNTAQNQINQGSTISGIYAGQGRDIANIQQNTAGQQGAGLQNQAGLISQAYANQGGNLANLDTTQANNQAQMTKELGGNIANLNMGVASGKANIISGQGNASAAANQQLGGALANSAFQTQNQIGQIQANKQIAQAHLPGQITSTYLTLNAIKNPDKYTGLFGG